MRCATRRSQVDCAALSASGASDAHVRNAWRNSQADRPVLGAVALASTTVAPLLIETSVLELAISEVREFLLVYYNWRGRSKKKERPAPVTPK